MCEHAINTAERVNKSHLMYGVCEVSKLSPLCYNSAASRLFAWGPNNLHSTEKFPSMKEADGEYGDKSKFCECSREVEPKSTLVCLMTMIIIIILIECNPKYFWKIVPSLL